MKWITIILGLSFLTIKAQQQGRLILEENTFHLKKDAYWIVDSTGGMYIVSHNGYLGMVNETGQLVCDAKFDMINPFTYSEATTVTQKGKYGIINRKGELVVPCEYKTIKPFHSNVTAFEKDGEWGMGIINSNGDIVPSETYWHLSSFHEGMAVGLTKAGDYFLVDSTGEEKFIINRYKNGLSNHIKNELLEQAFQYKVESYKLPLYKYHKGVARGINPETLKYCFVDKEGNQLFGKDFEYIHAFKGEFAAVKTAEGWNYIDKNGSYQSEIWYQSLYLSGSAIIAENNNLVGVLDTANNVIVPFKYKRIIFLSDDLFAVYKKSRIGKGHKWGVVDLDNITVLPCIYEGINFDPKTGIGKAGVYDHSISLNTGVPRYTYYGHYFLFDHTGLIDKKEYQYSMLVEGISDWHVEGSESYWIGGFAPPLDDNNYGLKTHKTWVPSILNTNPNPSKITVTNSNEKEILSASSNPYVDVKIYINCIIVRDSKYSIVYDHFGKRIFQTKDNILDGHDNGTFRMYTGNDHKEIDAHGNIID